MLSSRHWIADEWVESPVTGDSIDPATGEVIGHFGEAGPELAERAVQAAKRAFNCPGWKDDRWQRAAILDAMARRFEERAEELVALLGRENGKVAGQARFETGIVPRTLRYNAALALTEQGRAAAVAPGGLSVVLRQPLGVAGIIAPWNSPVALSIRSLAPALAAGCTAVIMLPRQTAQVNTLIAEIIAGTPGLPPGVVNVFTGNRASGSVLVESPDVPTISFTGSSATGRAIAAASAPHLKKLGLELGGKTPIIVFDDADLNAAVPKIVLALTVFSGQFCMTGSRLLVQRGIADRLREQVSEALARVRVGPASDPASEMGPLISRAEVERVDAMVERAIVAGARVVLRGGPAKDGPLASGAFFLPALLEVDDSSPEIVQQEVFGPVLALERFSDERDAVQRANATPYGLAASVWSRDADRPLRIAAALDAGTIWTNDWAVLHDQFEEGGFKQSGLGRMRGFAVLEDFLEYKHLTLHPGTVADPDPNASA